MGILPNLRSLSLPANLNGLADDIQALEERLLASAAGPAAATSSSALTPPVEQQSASAPHLSGEANSSDASKAVRPRRRRRGHKRRLRKRSMSIGVMTNAGDSLLFDDDDDASEFVWLSHGESDCNDDEFLTDDDEEDDDSFTHYMLARQTPNNSLYSRDKVGATVVAASEPPADTVSREGKRRTEATKDSRSSSALSQSYLPSFVGEQGDDANDGDDNSIGFMSLPDIEEGEEREDPVVERAGADCGGDAQMPGTSMTDVQTALAILNDLSGVLGLAQTLVPLPAPQQQEEEASDSSLPSSPNTVMGWYPGGGKAADLGSALKEQTQGLATRSASLDPARMMQAARTCASNDDHRRSESLPTEVQRQFALLQPGDRTRSMPARLIPPPFTAKPKKSALKRTSSICRSQTSLTEEEGSAVASVSSSDGGGGTSATGTMSRALQPSSRASSTNSLKRNVSFNKLDIREYSIALSDHPGCSYGPPVQLGWEYQDKETLNVEEYEEKRPPRRSVSELIMSYNVRRYLLLKRAGYSKSEIQAAMKEVERVKRDRLVTDLLLPASKIDETLEEVILSFKEILFPPPKKRSSAKTPRDVGRAT
jgi:hypothetical protein